MAPIILPKGIVFNLPNLYDEVAGYRTVPPEKIWEYWRGMNWIPNFSPARAPVPCYNGRKTDQVQNWQFIQRPQGSLVILLLAVWRISGGMYGVATEKALAAPCLQVYLREFLAARLLSS